MQGKRTLIELCPLCSFVSIKSQKKFEDWNHFFLLSPYEVCSLCGAFPPSVTGLPMSFLRSLLVAIQFFARVFPLCGNPYPLYGSSYPFCGSSCPFCGSPYPLWEPLSSLSKFLYPPLWEPLSSLWEPFYGSRYPIPGAPSLSVGAPILVKFFAWESWIQSFCCVEGVGTEIIILNRVQPPKMYRTVESRGNTRLCREEAGIT